MKIWGIGAVALAAGIAAEPAAAQVTFNSASGSAYSYAYTGNSAGSNSGSGYQTNSASSPNDVVTAASTGISTTSITSSALVKNTPPYNKFTNPQGGYHVVTTTTPVASATASGSTYGVFNDAYSGTFGFNGISSASTAAGADANTYASAFDYNYFQYVFTSSSATTVTVNYDVNHSNPNYNGYLCVSTVTCYATLSGAGSYTFNAPAGQSTLYAYSNYGDYINTTGAGATAQMGSLADVYNFSIGAVPEPATWALMILGFGAVGGSLRARRSRKPVAATA